MNTLNRYIELNNSFEKTLVFHVGADSGFFSEYNNMLIAMVYCLEHRIKFVLYSNDANFGFNAGWDDYFLPFCEERKERFHHWFNFRMPLLSVSEWFKNIREKKKIFGLRKQCCFLLYTVFRKKIQRHYRFDYLTYELWPLFYQKKNETATYHIPELSIQGSLHDACRAMVRLTWRFNTYMQNHINVTLGSIQLPSLYIGLQVRGGDKAIEVATIAADQYITRLELLGKEATALFVLTDHFDTINKLKNKGGFEVYTLCSPDAKGYVHQQFSRQQKEIIKENISNLLCSVEALTKSAHFIGTYTANPSIFVALTSPEISEDIEGRSLILIDLWKNE